MKLLHDEELESPEATPGLPQPLPEGERMLWQGKPSATAFAIHIFHLRFVALYFGVATVWRIANIASTGGDAAAVASVAASSSIGFVAACGLLLGLAWAMARSTIYTLTDKRIVLRFGVAIPKYINVPFAAVTAAALKRHGRGKGSIALSVSDNARIGYLRLWPLARPLRFSRPQPMLRGVRDAETVASDIAEAMKAFSPATVNVATKATTALEEASATQPGEPAFGPA
ncbi:MAG: photosynthetic complex putative assembly protein PuhB [Pseudomonadota bacterium]